MAIIVHAWGCKPLPLPSKIKVRWPQPDRKNSWKVLRNVSDFAAVLQHLALQEILNEQQSKGNWGLSVELKPSSSLSVKPLCDRWPSGARKPKVRRYLITVSFWLCYGWDLIKLNSSCNGSPQASSYWASNWVHLLWTGRSSELVQTSQYQICSLITTCSSKERRGFKKIPISTWS